MSRDPTRARTVTPRDINEPTARHLRHPRRDQLLSSAQRHVAVVAAGALSGAQEPARADFWSGGIDHAHIPDHRVAVAAAHRPVHRPAPTTLLVVCRDGIHA